MQQPEQLNIIAETDNFYVWHEYPEPRATGQANVVPKEHKESIMDLTPGEYSEAMTLVREVMEKAKTGIDAEGLTVVIPEGQMGGQMLDHMYIQIFPRFEEDENAGTPASAVFPQKEMSEQEIKDTADTMASTEVNFQTETIEPHPDSQKFKEKETHSQGREEGNEADQEETEEAHEEEFESKSYSWE
ncbi:Histidine triad (HIT) family protein [Candidatus Nanohalovita haloferacivicina]|nr:Histidine triad (HIT) family protein [Candidatus Nanohalobia archaeon BNXNv]